MMSVVVMSLLFLSQQTQLNPLSHFDRVTRGSAWQQNDRGLEDGKKGGKGTVVAFTNLPPKRALVYWDEGISGLYHMNSKQGFELSKVGHLVACPQNILGIGNIVWNRTASGAHGLNHERVNFQKMVQLSLSVGRTIVLPITEGKIFFPFNAYRYCSSKGPHINWKTHNFKMPGNPETNSYSSHYDFSASFVMLELKGKGNCVMPLDEIVKVTSMTLQQLYEQKGTTFVDETWNPAKTITTKNIVLNISDHSALLSHSKKERTQIHKAVVDRLKAESITDVKVTLVPSQKIRNMTEFIYWRLQGMTSKGELCFIHIRRGDRAATAHEEGDKVDAATQPEKIRALFRSKKNSNCEVIYVASNEWNRNFFDKLHTDKKKTWVHWWDIPEFVKLLGGCPTEKGQPLFKTGSCESLIEYNAEFSLRMWLPRDNRYCTFEENPCAHSLLGISKRQLAAIHKKKKK
eukprot:m.59008 g.59008  ORF g.59008 m.59008 type:complete len:460 (-) comp11213_c0_seq2:106-1485(-)